MSALVGNPEDRFSRVEAHITETKQKELKNEFSNDVVVKTLLHWSKKLMRMIRHGYFFLLSKPCSALKSNRAWPHQISTRP